MGDVSGTDPLPTPLYAAILKYLYAEGCDLNHNILAMTNELHALVVRHQVATGNDVAAARQALAAIRGDIAYVESTYKILEPDPLSDWSAGVTWMIDRLSALLSGVLGEAQQDRSEQ